MRRGKTHGQIELEKKQSRAKYKCSPELANIIDTINLVPPLLETQKRIDISDKLRNHFGEQTLEELKEIYGVNFRKVIEKAFAEGFYPLSQNFQISLLKAILCEPNSIKYIIGAKELSGYSFAFNVDNAYWRFIQLCKDFRGLVEYFTTLRKEGISAVGMYNVLSDVNTKPTLPLLTVSLQAIGTIVQVIPSNLAKAIDGIDGDRLRACEICKRIFWANYKNSFTCSKPCLNALRQRRHRKTNKEAINAKRRENYRRNKKLQQIKEGKNGTL
jgi:hypothetical protein